MTDDAKPQAGDGRDASCDRCSSICVDCGCRHDRHFAVDGAWECSCGDRPCSGDYDRRAEPAAPVDENEPAWTLMRNQPAAPPRNAPLTEEMYPWLAAPPRADDVADAIRTAEGATSRLLREQWADRDRLIAELHELLAFAKAEDIKMLTTIAELRAENAERDRTIEAQRKVVQCWSEQVAELTEIANNGEREIKAMNVSMIDALAGEGETK